MTENGGCPFSPVELSEKASAFHLYDPEIEDYWSLLRGLRRQLPVFRSEMFGGFWVLTRYEDCRQVLRDPQTFSSKQIMIPAMQIPGAEGGIIPEETDGEEHAIYRAALDNALGPRRISELESEVRERARTMLSAFAERGHGDLVKEFCVPLPAVTFALLLGMPLEDLDQLLYWKDRILRDGMGADEHKREEVYREVLPAMVGHFDAVIAARKAQSDPPNDLLTALARARFQDREWTAREQQRAIQQYLLAGLDTVSNAMSSMLEFLISHPGHVRQLVDEPELIPGAVEELLRYCGLTGPGRIVTRQVEVGGQTFMPGDVVHVLLPATGRDPDAFVDADRVDFTRRPNRHLAFGLGPHRCQGSHLARMQLRVALDVFVELLPTVRMAPGFLPRQHWGFVFGFDELEVVASRE